MGRKQQGRGQKRAAKVASRKRKVRQVGQGRPVVTVPGLDSYEPGPVSELDALDEMRYAVADIRTARRLGPNDGNPEWLEALEATLDTLAGATEEELVVEIIDDRVRRAVDDTLEAGTAEPAREEVRCLIASDGEMGDPDADPDGLGGAPAQGVAFMVLIGWLANQGPRPIPTAARTRVPEWVRGTLGAEAGDAVDTVIGVIGSTEEREAAIGPVADGLGDDFLAALMWIAAGLVALYGDGDVDTYLAFPEGVPA
ncbi:hypothetical protein GCM10009836_41400 [Pseudonocardia ailaonensis]|uniref:DUF2017 domain-containing protein n=1 Tax=Pseudonocardia ailaonensis TaxID=367279 RepID=A0ABN2N996_9PSEU